jgi:hypothetical protein
MTPPFSKPSSSSRSESSRSVPERKEKPSKKAEAAEAFWFSGTPSRYELAVQKAVRDFLDVTSIVYSHLRPPRMDIREFEWWRDLPRTLELKKQGLIDCAGHACK